MTCPRALRSPVMAMARPRRPVAEIAAVREAAEAIRQETGLTSAQGLGREIARRVIALLLDDLRNDPANMMPLPAMDPITHLAFGEGCAALDDLSDDYWSRIRTTYGVSLVPEFQQMALRRSSAVSLAKSLSCRYARYLRLAGD